MLKVEWEETFFEVAKTFAKRSKDRSTKVGCVIVDATNRIKSVGYNGFPRGVDDEKEILHERPTKYLATVHAEANAIAAAASMGISLTGCAAYVTLPPCAQCAGLLLNAGVRELNTLLPEKWVENKSDERVKMWIDSFRLSLSFFKEVGDVVRIYKEQEGALCGNQFRYKQVGWYNGGIASYDNDIDWLVG